MKGSSLKRLKKGLKEWPGIFDCSLCGVWGSVCSDRKETEAIRKEVAVASRVAWESMAEQLVNVKDRQTSGSGSEIY